MRSLEDIARSLYSKLAMAEPAPFREVRNGHGTLADDWKPLPRICYDNVDIWVRRSPEHKSTARMASL